MDPEKPDTGVSWPNIGDYWPDAHQRIEPPADSCEDAAAEPARVEPPPRRQRPVRPEVDRGTAKEPGDLGRPWFLAALAATALVVLGGGMAAFRYVTSSPVAEPGPTLPRMTTVPTPIGSGGPASVLPPTSPSQPAPPPRSSPPSTAMAPPSRPAGAAGGASTWSSGTFLLADDVSAITLSMARVDHGIARVGVPDNSDAAPETTVDGTTLKLAVNARGSDDKNVIVQLDDRISWAIRLGGGAHAATLHLDGGSLRSLSFDGGVGMLDVTLPELRSTLPIQLRAGVGIWRMSTKGQVAVALVAHKGGGSLVLYGHDKGSQQRGERTAVNGRAGLAVTADAGFGSLTVVET